MNSDLKVKTARIGARGFPVQLAALEHHHVHAGPGEVIGQGTAGEPASNHGYVGALGQRGAEVCHRREQQRATMGRAYRRPTGDLVEALEAWSVR